MPMPNSKTRLDAEAGIDRHHFEKAAHEQSRAEQQRHAQRDLADDQSAA